MAFQSKSGGAFQPPKKSTTFRRGKHPFPKINRAQPADLVRTAALEPGPKVPAAGSSPDDKGQQVLTAPGFAKRVQDPGHGPTPKKLKSGANGVKRIVRKRAAPTHAMKSFGGQI